MGFLRQRQNFEIVLNLAPRTEAKAVCSLWALLPSVFSLTADSRWAGCQCPSYECSPHDKSTSQRFLPRASPGHCATDTDRMWLGIAKALWKEVHSDQTSLSSWSPRAPGCWCELMQRKSARLNWLCHTESSLRVWCLSCSRVWAHRSFCAASCISERIEGSLCLSSFFYGVHQTLL